MHEIITAFGIDWRLIAIQIFNFALLLGALWYFLYTPILTMIEKRRGQIEQGVKDAEAAKAELAAAEGEKASIVREAHQEAEAVALRAKEHAAEKAAALVRDAEAKKARILEDAKREGEEMKSKLYKESEAEIAKTALLAAEKILKERA
jgi:F-type H+-transporting ATPase subunit b